MTIYHPRGGWGNTIRWWVPGTQLTGHLTPLPQVGDEFHSPMESGRTGVYVITTVRPCWNPSDQFFATVEWRGYADDLSHA